MVSSECSGSERIKRVSEHSDVVQLILNRPEKNNAFDDVMIRELSEQIQACDEDNAVRVVILRGAGRHFCAGADLQGMQEAGQQSQEENLAAAKNMAQLMHALANCSKPTMAIVHGAVYGGGVGLVACCDIAIGLPDVRFCLSEAKLGLIPAVISPYVIAAIGERMAKCYMLTAQVMHAKTALGLGLLHDVVSEVALQDTVVQWQAQLLACGPKAQAAIKTLVADVVGKPIDQNMMAMIAKRIAQLRSQEEAQTRIKAFFDNRS